MKKFVAMMSILVMVVATPELAGGQRPIDDPGPTEQPVCVYQNSSTVCGICWWFPLRYEGTLIRHYECTQYGLTFHQDEWWGLACGFC